MSRDNFLYLQIYNELKGKIDDGIYKTGAKLPSDEELTSLFKVSMITVKKALGILKDEGLVQRIPGVGTFVKERDPSMTDEKIDIREPATKKIGVVLEHVSSSYGLDLLYKIDQLAEEKGYKTLIRFSYYNREKEDDEIDFLTNSQIDGLIVMPCHGVYYNPKIIKLILEGFPVVVIDKKLEGIPVPSVRTDNKQAIESLVKSLWEQGCKKICFATSEIVGTSSLLDRRNGFYEAAQEYAFETLPECSLTFDEIVYDHQVSEANIEVAMKYLTEHKGQLDGIVCAEYSLIPAVMEASRRIGAGVGENIKLCCVDGPSGLPITHMKQNEIEIADKVVALLLAQINGKKTETDIMVPAVMVVNQN